jgi:hypothetical protein
MIKKFMLLVLLSSFLGVHAQSWDFEKPDYKKIEKNIKKENSNFYYSDLMDRFAAADTTLTIEQRRHLYYGYTFQPEYDPYGRSGYEDSLRPMWSKDSLNESDYRTILKFSDSLLKQDPFSLEAMNMQLFANDMLNNNAAVTNLSQKAGMIVETLMSSGNGVSKETAFYVINTSHEYQLLNVFGFQFGGEQSLIEHYDRLTLAENEQGVEALYFDVTPCLNHLNQMFDE